MLDDIQNMWLFVAGVMSAFSMLIHVFAGGPQIAHPMLRSKDIPDVSKFVNYYCWHLVTMIIAAMAVGLIWASIDPSQTGLAWMWTVMAVLFTLWSLVLLVWKRQRPLDMPQWVLFAVISLFAVTGLVS